MAVVDDDTQYVPVMGGTGAVDSMAIGPTINGKTQINFIQFRKVTEGHVDEAAIVSQANLSEEDLRALSRLITERLKQITD